METADIMDNLKMLAVMAALALTACTDGQSLYVESGSSQEARQLCTQMQGHAYRWQGPYFGEVPHFIKCWRRPPKFAHNVESTEQPSP